MEAQKLQKLPNYQRSQINGEIQEVPNTVEAQIYKEELINYQWSQINGEIQEVPNTAEAQKLQRDPELLNYQRS